MTRPSTHSGYTSGIRAVVMVLAPIVIMLAFLSLWRLGLYIWQFDRVQATGEYGFVFLQGVRFDLITLAAAMIIPVSLTPLFMMGRGVFRRWRVPLLVYMTLWFGLLLFMELATPSFINQYDSRPNYLFVEYLKHYREVGATLLAEYPWQLALSAILLPLGSIAFFRVSRRLLAVDRPLHWTTVAALVPVLFVTFAVLARSSLGHRPANPSTVSLTSDHLVNDLALNSTYTVLYAIYLSQQDAEGGFHYGVMPFAEVVDVVRGEMDVDAGRFTDPQIPTLHRQDSARHRDRPYNLVIVLEESLGAEFVGRLGGLPLTPNLDRLAGEGLWFDNLYATGTRSVRGIEAVVSGFLPTPAVSVVKLNKSQRDFFTLAQLLDKHGYDTGFIYGGESHFDNMRGFFLNNGFNYVIDENDFDAQAFRGSWGVSDEDLFDKAHQKFSTYADKPFFSLVFTSSNHAPFEFPDGRIELYEPEKNTVNNAVKYADYAVGRFIERARQSSYWNNTVFIVIADHNSRVYGSSLVPIDRFHIPAVILGPDIRPEVVTTLASQIDIAPTLLSLIGVSATHPMIGRDLTRPENRRRPGRAIMQFNGTQAYMEDNNVIVLRKDLPPKTLLYRDGELQEAADDPPLVKKAIAHSLFAQTAYADRLYRLPR